MGRSHKNNSRLAGHQRNGLLGLDEIAPILDVSERKLVVVKRGNEASRNGLELVFGKDEEVLAWIVKRLPVKLKPDEFKPCTTIGIQDKATGELIAAAVYHRWTPFSCELTFAAASPRWCKKGILAALFHYPFEQRSCVRMTLVIGANNKRAIKLNLGLGFKLEGIARKAYDGINDAWVLGMLREECKWVRKH